MSNDKSKPQGGKNKPATPGKTAASNPEAQPIPALPPLFRKIDWLTFTITTLLVFIGYYLTLAPDLTLEDSGELAVGSFYAGVPHPPGYPVWTLFTWLFTVLVPVANIAYRVALASAVSGALASGFLALLVSRGSSMMIEGITDLKTMDRRWESAICVVSGFVTGMLLGFNGYMWSQAVIVEVYPFSGLSLVGVLLCLMRWIYAPHQRRYIYWALFLFGICITNHQTLLVIAMGIEVAIIATQPKLGRDFMIGNSVLYIIGLVFKANGYVSSWNSAPGQMNMIYVIFNLVGIASLYTFLWYSIKNTPLKKLLLISVHFFLNVVIVLTWNKLQQNVPQELNEKYLAWTLLVINGVGIALIYSIGLAIGKAEIVFTNWKCVLISGLLFAVGAGFYLYMPLAGMSDPPMQWGYPRTVEGFIHALTRGQYEKASPTNFITDPLLFFQQVGIYFDMAKEEFNVVYLLIALVPFLFVHRMQKRERAWMIGLTALWLCLAVLLMVIINPAPGRQSRGLIKVFFTASHFMIATWVGYGLTLIFAFMATQYARFRTWGLYCGAGATALALFSLANVTQTFFGDQPGIRGVKLFFYGISKSFEADQYGLPVYAGLIVLGLAIVYALSILAFRTRPPLSLTLALFAIIPADSVLSHWFDNEERQHLFGYWFGHDMFTPPFGIYPEMTRDTVLFGGTDPGRFCPTYMIFCESFIPTEKKAKRMITQNYEYSDPHFDRRDVYIITQNALADGTYLSYIRAHYNRSTQIDPPFFQELFRSKKEVEQNYSTNIFSRIAYTLLDRPFTALGDRIEKRRRVGSSYFTEKDFTDLPGLTARLRKSEQQDSLSKYLFDHFSKETQELLSRKGDERTLRRTLAKELNLALEREFAEQDPAKRESLYTPDRFRDRKLSDPTVAFLAQNPQSHTRIRLNRLLLEEAYPDKITKSPGGVYPDREIHTPTLEDSQRCFSEYLQDAQRRLDHDSRFPNEPRQIKLGEDVRIVGEGGQQRVQVAGQVAVMSINGLLTKVIFDKNPGHEFYVEESFPLDWMYPYLSPFGIIMKINRQPLAEVTEEMVKKDHDFWSRYSERLIGNWITYDTTIKEITDFIEKVYLQHDFKGFKGDRKFVRDDQAQKAFSKLRSSIGGIYGWRVNFPKNSAEQQRMMKEAGFAYKQAFAFCPYSPEAVFRYANLLLNMHRFDDALLVANTCKKLDPFNGQIDGLISNLNDYQQRQAQFTQTQNNLQQLEKEVRDNPTNFQAAFNLASAYMQLQQTNRVIQILDGVLNNPKAEASAILAVAQAYVQMNNYAKLEATLERLVKAVPDGPEAWYDLAAIKAALGKSPEAISNLRQALNLSAQRLARDPKQRDLRVEAMKDPRFNTLRPTREFQELVAPK